MIHNIQSEKIDKQLATTLVSLYFIHFINNVAKSILPIPDVMWRLISFIGFAIGGLLLLIILPKAIKRYPIVFIVAEAIGILLYCVSSMQNHENLSTVLERAFWTLGICIPMGFMAYSINDKQILYDKMLKASYYMTALISMVFFFNWFGSPGTYNMSFSYSLLYPLLFHLNAFFNKKTTIHLLLSLYQTTIILLYGSRGALLCVIVFLIIKITLNIRKTISKITTIGIGGMAFILFYIYFEAIGNSILSALGQHGYYSRTLTTMFNGSIMSSSGRESIQLRALNMIMEKPLLGWGAGGEFHLLGTYPHSLFIELLLDFGLILGGIISVVIIATVIKTFFLTDDKLRDLLFIYLCTGFIPLMLSSTYLKQYELFIFMFLSSNALSRKTTLLKISRRLNISSKNTNAQEVV